MKRTRILIIIATLLFLLTACNLSFQSNIPRGGTWECDTLHVIVDFSEKNGCNATVVKNDAKIQCLAGHNKNSNALSIICQDDMTDLFAMGEVIYRLRCVRLTSDTLTVIDEITETEHVFFNTERKPADIPEITPFIP